MSKLWGYRILRLEDDRGEYYGIHKVFYKNGCPIAHESVPVPRYCTSLDDLRDSYNKEVKAFSQSILDARTYKKINQKTGGKNE